MFFSGHFALLSKASNTFCILCQSYVHICCICNIYTIYDFFWSFCTPYICYAQTMDRDNPWIALLKVWIRALRGQSMDCPALAQSMDCATTHVTISVRTVEVVIFQCQKPPSRTASQNRLCRRRKDQGDWSRVRKRKSWLTFRLVKIRAIHWMACCVFVWHTINSSLQMIIIAMNYPGMSIEDTTEAFYC